MQLLKSAIVIDILVSHSYFRFHIESGIMVQVAPDCLETGYQARKIKEWSV